MRFNTATDRARRGAWLPVFGMASALVVSACGAGSALGGGTELSEADKTRIAEEFRDCMAEGGLEAEVDLSSGIDISVDGSEEMSTEQMLAVEAGCESILEGLDGGEELTPDQEARMADVLLSVQKCLAEDGYVITISGNGIDLNGDDQPADFDEAAYAEAEDACFREADPELYEQFESEGG